MTGQPIKVFIVDDSAVLREFLTRILSTEGAFEVIGAAGSGEEALTALETLEPDLITMDISLPGVNGLETTRLIMETRPVPIVIITGDHRAQDVMDSFNLMEIGALAVLEKPPAVNHPDYAAHVRSMVETLKMVAEIRVVKRQSKPLPSPSRLRRAEVPVGPAIVAIGASTGGPGVIKTILSGLPTSFPWPVLIVQHMTEGFLPGFVEWLNLSSSLPVQLAVDGEKMQPGQVYMAPDGHHLRTCGNGSLSVASDPPVNNQRPAVSTLLAAVTRVYGRNAIGILLSGMGSDGACELLQMREAGALTVAQDEASCIVYGMPGAAVALQGARYTLSPERIAALLTELAHRCSSTADHR